MPLNDAALDVGGEAIAAAIVGISFHNGDPGPSGTANLLTGGRAAVDINSTDGDLSLAAPVTKSGLPAETPVTDIGFWSTSTTGGTYYGSADRISGDEETNAAGEYTVNALSIPANAT